MAGNLDIQNKSRFEQRKEVSHMAIHPNYTGTNNNFKNDVCILRLLTPLRMNSMINKITVEKSESQPGTQCQISGWGSKHVNILYTSYISLSHTQTWRPSNQFMFFWNCFKSNENCHLSRISNLTSRSFSARSKCLSF